MVTQTALEVKQTDGDTPSDAAAEARLRRFRGALRIAGTTVEKWAASHGVTYGHLRFVMRGERSSPRLNAEIDRFIEEHVRAA